MSHLLTNFCPQKKVHSKGSIVFTTFILHSLHPIVFLEIVKGTRKDKNFYTFVLEAQNATFLFEECQKFEFFNAMGQ
jgi:hypothetical protein